MDSQLAIEVKSLTKTFRTLRGPVEALRGLDLQVHKGEIFGYIGMNGAGKSTSIKILLGLIQATSGQAQIFGNPAGTLSARRLVGYLPEVATYHEFMSAEELLHLHARLAGVSGSEIARRCDYALGVVGLSERRKSRLSEFSKGMKQRFGIAQALIGEPPLLILDELTSGLDPFAQRDLRDILLSLRAKNITVFFSSHYMTEIESVCDRAAIIHKGRLQVCGTIDELTRNEHLVEILLAIPEPALDQLGDVRIEASDDPTLRKVRLARQDADGFLARAVAAGCSIRDLRTVQRSLEDVFYSVTRDQEQEVKS